ncbi:MAG: exodeoxyribonuclease V subunit beta [Gammaproteobacteria bacterium]|nr:exodeoxyribonuclease V subunit beta [Gammaproteobacteria bacterium]
MRRPLDIPLDQDLLVEASAGTGKTHALTTLVARLIVESAWRIDRLLVVTFTIAATGELRSRVRSMLRDALNVARGQDGEISQAGDLVRRWRSEGVDPALIELRLTVALRDFHRANVMTIHGFCQRALTEFAFDARIPFEFGVSGDDYPEVGAALRDFWRESMADEPEALLEFANDQEFRLDDLNVWVADHHAKPSRIRNGYVADDYEQRYRADHDTWLAAFQSARTAWNDDDQRTQFLAALDQLHWYSGKSEVNRRVQEAVSAAFKANDPQLLPLNDAGYFGRETLTDKVQIRSRPLPNIPLYDHFTNLGMAATQLGKTWLPNRRRRLLEDTRRWLQHDTWKHRRLSFNALLQQLDTALEGEQGRRLAERIRARYPVALIDEFQDTDRLQARIFEQVYPAAVTDGTDVSAHGGLMIVGDPKQSIYRFRGADVFAYLKASAKRQSVRTISLERNYRSTHALVGAVNAVFQCSNPFLRPETIRFDPAKAARGPSEGLRMRGRRKTEPFQLHLFPEYENGRKWTKTRLEPTAAKHAADEIARLLLPGEATLRVDGKSKPLVGSDVAVLVRTGKQGRIVAHELQQRGVQSVEMGIDSVFETHEARDLGHLLRALVTNPAEYNHASLLRGALATDLFGLDMSELAALQDDDDSWERWRGWARDSHDTWNQKGIATLVRRLLFAHETNCASHLLKYPDGRRRLTNLMHLIELMQEAEIDGRLSPRGLVDWLARAAARPEFGDEGTQLRLESDEHLVKIVTIHRSKGLEFPVVFCPFAWFRLQRSSGKTAEYHELEGDFAEILDLNPSDGALDREWLEDQADELRLLYVALTRAKHHCVVTWARANDGEHAPLAWLIHGRGEPRDDTLEARLEANATHVKSLDGEAWLGEVQQFANAEPDAISTSVLRDATAVPRRLTETLELPGLEPLAARTLGRPLQRIRQRTSFSALTSDMGAAVTAAEHEDVDQPDHDQDDVAVEDEGAAPIVETEDRLDVFTFPSGFRPGNCLHEIFERNVEPDADLDEICSDVLAKYRIDAKWVPAARTMVENALNASLESPADGSVFRLGEVERPIAEMEFHLPLNGMDRASLARCFAAHGYSHGIPDSSSGIDGFLHGFIDVVARHGERWYVMDYKSNWLGDNIHAYSGQAVRAAMAAHGYAAQYLFYLTALHRFLRLRLPDYDYERHIGGVFYLFVRGMSPDMPGQGIYRDAPTRACIEAIDACFEGATG